jgi:hypothetical protein
MIDTKDMPDELVRELGGVPKEDRKYTAHDHALAYINAHDGVTANDLLVYLYKAMDKVTSRGYLYHILGRLRKAGLIETRDMRKPGEATHFTTQMGSIAARPYWELDDND